MAESAETVRLNLRISTSVRDRLERVKETAQAESLTQVIRNSLVLYDALLEQTQQGSTVILRDKEGNEREVMLVF
jgi:hypothetical protein